MQGKREGRKEEGNEKQRVLDFSRETLTTDTGAYLMMITSRQEGYSKAKSIAKPHNNQFVHLTFESNLAPD